MAITQTETLIPKAHSKLVVFRDHFGHEHKVVVPTHIAVEDPIKLFPVGPVVIQEFDAQLENIAQMMRDRELAFLGHCLDNGHAQHPLVVSHPDHPKNVQKMQIVQILENSPKIAMTAEAPESAQPVSDKSEPKPSPGWLQKFFKW